MSREKIIAEIIAYLEDKRIGKDISHKAMTLNNEEIWMFKKEDILRLTEI